MAGKLSVTLFSDGGGERDSAAGGACIVRDASNGTEIRLALYLGGGTNNEGEISAGLLGFSFLRALEAAERVQIGRVHWVCDSEYVLKSASQYITAWQKNGWKTAARKPVKNQGLWRAYLVLADDLPIDVEHVRGHTGHPENEACDVATTWLQQHGPSYLAQGGEGSAVDVGSGALERNWIVLDGRGFIEAVRDEHPNLEEINLLASKLKQFGLVKLAQPVAGSAPVQSAGRLTALLARVEEIRAAAAKLAGKEPGLDRLRDELEGVLGRLRGEE